MFASPVTNRDFSSLLCTLGPFESCPAIAIAVSGGADSMCLLLLADAWAKQQNGRAVTLTVDHGLRKESSEEAAQVKCWCEARNIEHHTLLWSPVTRHPSPATQSSAREARYRLLADWCRANHVLHLLTAHHQNDQVETLFFRLARASGIDGLAGMSAITNLQGIRLLRPLLPISKARLETTLRQSGQPWIEDPSNQNPRFARSILRRQLSASDIDISFASQLAERFGNIRNHMDNNVVSHLTDSISIFPEAYAVIDYSIFKSMPQEASLRVLVALTNSLNGGHYAPRSEKLARLYEEILSGTMTRRSFAGLLFIHQPKKNRFLVCREPRAIEKQTALHSGHSILWDHRFEVSHDGDKTLSVRALGAGELKILKKTVPKLLLEKPVLTALPSFWHLEQLAAVPHIGYRNREFAQITCRARFKPAKALAGAAFFSMNTLGIIKERSDLGPLRAAACVAPGDSIKTTFLLNPERNFIRSA